MTVTKSRSAFLGMTLAALLAAALVASGPPATAATKAAANPNCGAPVMFGLHGMGEGPSGKISKLSPEISDFDAAQNLISGAVLMVYVPYPTVYANGWDVLDTVNKGPLTTAVQTGISHLQSDVAAWAKGCPVSKDKIALVGYSMGAWVINEWLIDHPGEVAMIKAVALFGDPCWNYHLDRGLARIFTLTCSLNYPYLPDRTWTACLNFDPVCGGSFKEGLLGTTSAELQLTEAALCTKTSCPHLHYTDGAPSSGYIMEAARFVVQRLIG
jgi:predicted esterase